VALKAAEQLEQQGVSCEVIDPRTIRPLDIDTIVESVKKTNRVVLAEESHPICGVNAEISAEIYDPDSAAWSPAGNLSVARMSHTATLLADGKLLVTVGYGVGSAVLNTTELYDPATNIWSAAGTMNSPRSLHTATLLPGGGVLVVGGLSTLFYPPPFRAVGIRAAIGCF